MKIRVKVASWVVALGVLVGGASELRAGEPILQDGDIVIGGARVVDSFGSVVARLYRYRDGVVETIFDGAGIPGLSAIAHLFIDQQGRIVFTSGGCGGNVNNSALWRLDLATGVPELLACLPYIANAGNIPPGLPPEATEFYHLTLQSYRIYSTKVLRVTIDDDENGGWPQVGYEEAYGLTIGMRSADYPLGRPRSFRYLPEEGRFEDDVPLDLLSSGGALVVIEGSYTYYANGHQIGRAQPTLVLDVNLDGDWGSISGQLGVSGRNELLFSGEVLDNTTIPNVNVDCGDLEDDNVPLESSSFKVLSGINNVGFVDGGIFTTSNSVSSGKPYLFYLAPRGPFLNPFNCQFYPAVQYSGNIDFFQGKDIDLGIGDGGRIIGTQRQAGKLVSVMPDGSFQELAFGLVAPRGVAVYPPVQGIQYSRNLTLRVDQAVGHVLMTDPEGKRIGYLADGSEVNEIGSHAMVVNFGAEEGPPRMFTVSDPAAGNWRVSVAGLAEGAYELKAYLADTDVGGTRAMVAGLAESGTEQQYNLIVSPPLGLEFAPHIPGDLNLDGRVSLADYSTFAVCFGGPGITTPPDQCTADEFAATDLDGDGDVDLGDFSTFSTNYTG